MHYPCFWHGIISQEMKTTSVFAEKNPRNIGVVGDANSYYLDPGIRRRPDDSAIFICEQVSSDDAGHNIAVASKLSRELCSKLDEFISPWLNKIAGTQDIRFFFSIASYPAYLQAIIYLNLNQALNVLGKNGDRVILRCPDVRSDRQVIFSNITFPQAVQHLLGGKVFDVEPVPIFHHPVAPTGNLNLLMRALKYPNKGVRRICEWLDIKWYGWASSHDQPTILFFKPFIPLREMGRAAFGNYNLLLADEDTFPPDPKEISSEIRLNYDTLIEDAKVRILADKDANWLGGVMSLVLDDILSEVSHCLWEKQYFRRLLTLYCELERQKPRLGIWSVPPTFGFGRLVFECLKSRKIPVIGLQHGGLFGNQHNHEMMIPDLMRCSHYVSWGFTAEDVARTFPQEQPDAHIHPLGWFRTIRPKNKVEFDFDLVFPLTNTMSIMEYGMTREKPELLLARQERLIDYLDSLENVRVAIKPFPGANLRNCGVWGRLKSLRHSRVIWNISFSSFIEKYRVRGVVIEHLSTPIYEAIGLDVEIFCHLDSVLKVEKHALSLLEKRAHCYKSVEDMVGGIDLFIRGGGVSLRDNSFYNHFVSKPDAKNAFLAMINDLTGKE